MLTDPQEDQLTMELETDINEKTIFSEPVKRINDDSLNNNNKIKFFQMTKAFKRLKKYSMKYNKLMMETEVRSENDVHVIAIFDNYLFSKLNELIDKYPPLPKEEFAQRFGNIAVRSIHDELATKNKGILKNLLEQLFLYRNTNNAAEKYKNTPAFLEDSVVEISHYFSNSFGNRDRMDFGTGHELSFLAFLSTFEILNLVSYDTYTLKALFKKYYMVVMRLILNYNLEPAGSHGVWGLDDNYHFSFVLGSAQMIQKPLCKPKSSLSYAKENIAKVSEQNFNFLIWNLQVIGEVKNYKNFKEHSPMLNDILYSVDDWGKINNGLYKMWVDEVLMKFPVIQHFMFGKYFFPWKLTKRSKASIKDSKHDTSNKSREKNDLLRYRMNQITVDSIIDKNEEERQRIDEGNKSKRIFPMNPPKRRTPFNK